jgi:itaconyl-CoA hydratase
MLPSADITILSLEQAVAVPSATHQLVSLGARVMKIERSGVGDFARDYDETVRGMSSYFVWLNRSKENLMTIKEGWRGRFFEDFEVGDVYQHPLGRTVTTTDNIWFTLLTQNTAPIHFDHHYAAQTEFGKPLVDSTFTLALVTGQSVIDISQNVFANLGWDEVRLPQPVFEGDTIYSQTEVLEKRESRSRPNIGIVTVKTTGYNQDGKVVITFKRTIMVYKRGYAPQIVRLMPGELQ